MVPPRRWRWTIDQGGCKRFGRGSVREGTPFVHKTQSSSDPRGLLGQETDRVLQRDPPFDLSSASAGARPDYERDPKQGRRGSVYVVNATLLAYACP